LLAKVIDGATHGRLPRCSLCEGGRLKLQEDGVTVTCNGNFDEATNRRVDCNYSGTAEDAPRWQPWYTTKPSEADEEEMDRLVDIVKGEIESEENDEHVAALVKAAEGIEWNIGTAAGIKKGTKAMVKIIHNYDVKTVDILPDFDEAVRQVGPMIAGSRDLSAKEILKAILKDFGWKEDKETKAASKIAVQADMIGCSTNAPVVDAFRELGDLYRKDGNWQAASTCTKLVAALGELDFEITVDNAMGLSKGKTKVPGIGKASSEKMLELLSTGRMEKLEAKRAELAP
jgi:hypothetical protein